jgi:hypothetical protein
VLEVDEAIVGLGNILSSSTGTTPGTGTVCPVDDDDDAGNNSGSTSTTTTADITHVLIHQLVAVKKIVDLTGLSLDIVLTFWTQIPTYGDQSLYATTFLTHNMIMLDPVSQPDANGDYLTATEKISDHMSVLQASLRLKAADIQNIQQLRNIPDTLTLATLSELYRTSTLMRYLSVRSTLLPDIIAVFGQPFTDADTTLKLF